MPRRRRRKPPSIEMAQILGASMMMPYVMEMVRDYREKPEVKKVDKEAMKKFQKENL